MTFLQRTTSWIVFPLEGGEHPSWVLITCCTSSLPHHIFIQEKADVRVMFGEEVRKPCLWAEGIGEVFPLCFGAERKELT